MVSIRLRVRARAGVEASVLYLALQAMRSLVCWARRARWAQSQSYCEQGGLVVARASDLDEDAADASCMKA